MTQTIEDDEAKPPSQRVVEKVAAATNTDPLDVEPLYDRVDPDCLDTLFSDASPLTLRDEGRISFPMAGCQVVVRADGTVEVDPDDGEAGASFLGHGNCSPLTVPESPD